MKKNEDKEKAQGQEYFFPVYGGEAVTIVASSREEAEKIFIELTKKEYE